MEFIYYVINFLILIGLILLIGRKAIISIFKNRRQKIESDLDEAEKPFAPTAQKAEDGNSFDENETLENDVLKQISAENDAKIEKMKMYTALECQELSYEKAKKERKAILNIFIEKVKEKYNSENYRELEKRHNIAVLDEILPQITITPGTLSYLRYNDVLYVTLTSAYPLPEELVKRTDEATASLVEKIGGKTSFWVKEDASLIGGLKLRIGDTVYDGTVAEQIYRLSKEIEKAPLTENDSIDTIIASFESKIENSRSQLSVYQQGRVISVSDGICWMDGLSDIMYGEVVEFECGERGMVLDIQKDKIGCVIFGKFEHIESYSKVRRVGRIASVPVGEGLLGRVIDAIGNPIDRKGYIKYSEKRPIEYNAPGILDRSAVSRPMHTGIKAIDSMIPVGKGQRELIIGDRQTGKTAIILDTIINQKGKDVICIYVGIGQKETTIADFREKLESHGALGYTIIVSGSASESAAMQYIAPFAATAIGEYFMYSGKDVLIIYDDLSKHAVAYRELSLLLQRPSGREAYPGDIFYLHSRLLERSAQLSKELGGGSMTAFPIIETQAGDISSYIPTNVISITDGQIFLESELFHEGQRPAINVGLSVSRVGGSAQTKLMKYVSSDLRTKLAQYRELAEFTQFGAEMDDETKKMLNSGKHLTEALKQSRFSPLEDWKQALLLYAVSKGFTDNIEVSLLKSFEKKMFAYFEENQKDIVQILKTGKKPDETTITHLENAIAEFVKEF